MCLHAPISRDERKSSNAGNYRTMPRGLLNAAHRPFSVCCLLVGVVFGRNGIRWSTSIRRCPIFSQVQGGSTLTSIAPNQFRILYPQLKSSEAFSSSHLPLRAFDKNVRRWSVTRLVARQKVKQTKSTTSSTIFSSTPHVLWLPVVAASTVRSVSHTNTRSSHLNSVR